MNYTSATTCEVCGSPLEKSQPNCKPSGKYASWLKKIGFEILDQISEEDLDTLMSRIPQRIFATLRKPPYSLTPYSPIPYSNGA